MSYGRRELLFAGILAFGMAQLVVAQERQPGVPGQKTEPKQPAKLPTAPPSERGLPAGAVARLGQTRLRHADKVTCVVFAPDGKSFITGGDDGTLRVWSVATGEQLNLLQKTSQSVTSLKSTHGGKRLAVQFGLEALIRFLDPVTLKEIGSTPFINRHHFAFSPDGSLMATSDLSGNAVITEVEGDLPKLELTNADIFDFHPNGKLIAVGDAKGVVTVHHVTGGKPAFKTKLDGAIKGIAYSPNGTQLAVGFRGGDGTEAIHVFEGTKEKPLVEIAGVSLPKVWLGSDSLVCGSETEGGVYDLKKKEWASRIKGLSGEFAVSPDGTKLAATGSGLRVRLWDLATNKQLHAENDSFPDPTLLVGSADGKTLFLLTKDNAYLWSVGAETAKPAGKLPGQAVAAMVGGDKLLVATPDAVLVYDKFDPTKPLPAKPTHAFKDSNGAKAVAISPNGSRVAWAVDGGKIFVSDSLGKNAKRELPVTTTTVLALGFNPAGDRLGVLGRDPFLRVWNVSDKQDEMKEVWKARIQRGLHGMVTFSPDGKYVTAVSRAQLLVFDAADGKDGEDAREPLMRFERYSENGYVQHAAFSPDSRLLIVGSTGMYGRVEVWELATHDMVRTLVTGYGGTSRMCVFPDGKRAVSAGAEEAVTVWDLTFHGNKPAPKPDELLAAWKNLESHEAAVGYPAIKVFASAGNKGVEVLDSSLKDALAQEKKIAGWIEDLGSKTFSIHQVAERELIAQGIRALPAVTAATKSDDPEIRDRAIEVMKKLNEKEIFLPANGLTNEALRLIRTVQALEEIATPEAKKLLEVIAKTNGRPAEEAKAAIARLKK